MTKNVLKAGTKVKTTKKSVSKSGKQQFTGSTDLRGTQSGPHAVCGNACETVTCTLYACTAAQDLHVPLFSANSSPSGPPTAAG